MMKTLLLLLLSTLSLNAQNMQVTVSGTLLNPNGTQVNGTIQVALQRATATAKASLCGGTSTQVVTVYPVTIAVTNGVVTSTNLYSNSCINPKQPYVVKVYATHGTLIYSAKWFIPSTASTINITQVDCSINGLCK